MRILSSRFLGTLVLNNNYLLQLLRTSFNIELAGIDEHQH